MNDGTAGESVSSPEGIERVGLEVLIRDVTTRLSRMENAMLRLREPKGKSRADYAMEALKVVSTGWPAFGLILLILFYVPLKEVVTTIPERLRTAQEINMPGMSLKMAIKTEAARAGDLSLSETIPSLSIASIELLLKIAATSSIWAFTPNKDGHMQAVYYPSPESLKAFDELQQKGLVEIQESGKSISIAELSKMIDNWRRVHPGKEEDAGPERRSWTPERPIAPGDLNMVSYGLTAAGKRAREVIVSAVAMQLAQARAKPEGAVSR